MDEPEQAQPEATPAAENFRITDDNLGVGSLPQTFDENNGDWTNEFLELQAALTPEEYASARTSTLNAHYARFVP